MYEALRGFSLSFIPRTTELFILILALIISAIIFCLVPVIIRFVNCWTELKEEISKLSETNDNNINNNNNNDNNNNNCNNTNKAE